MAPNVYRGHFGSGDPAVYVTKDDKKVVPSYVHQILLLCGARGLPSSLGLPSDSEAKTSIQTFRACVLTKICLRLFAPHSADRRGLSLERDR